MLFVFRSAFDPRRQNFFLLESQAAVRRCGRRLIVLGRSKDASDEFACLWFACNYCAFLDGDIAIVEPQLGLPFVRVHAVAVETVLRENGPHVAVESNFLWQTWRAGSRDSRQQQKSTN